MSRIGLAIAALILSMLALPQARAATTYNVLFDDTKAETAGNADWIVSTSMPDPLAQNASPSAESSWTGAISAWGVALQRTGRYSLKTLPPTGSITYGNSSNALDLSHFNAFVLPEPNVLLTAAEKTAIMRFVQAGGGLFMISDHNGSDRNNDGADSVKVLNDLMTNNSVDATDPFGFSIDVLDISSDNPSGIGSSTRVINGPFGTVTGTIIRAGTTATLHPADNANARGEIYRTGYSTSGTTGIAFATSTFGSGRVAFWGDSSPMDDGTGQSGNTLYDGWDDPAGTDATLALNATEWLSAGTATSGGTERVANGGFESGSSSWTLSGAVAVTTTRAHSGTHSAAMCGVNGCADTVSQQVALPTGTSPRLTFWTYVTTQETGTTAYDKLAVRVNGTTVATLSNASTKGSWFATSAGLSAYAGQTVTLAFAATNGTVYPTGFWVDDVSVLA